MPIVINLWPYQSSYPWATASGILTDQSRLWIDALYKSLGALAAGGGGGITPVGPQTPSGAMNGTNTIFTITATPDGAHLILFLNGVEQVAGVDYTLAGTVITFTVPPKSDDLMVAQYVH